MTGKSLVAIVNFGKVRQIKPTQLAFMRHKMFPLLTHLHKTGWKTLSLIVSCLKS